MNWGIKILITISGFICMMLLMVFIAFKQNIHMIDDNYYERELNYQNIIDSENRWNQLSNIPAFRIEADSIYCQLPFSVLSKNINCSIQFIKIDNPDLDKTFSFNEITSLSIPISKKILNSGNYTVRILARLQNLEYFRQENLLIP